MSDTFFPRKPGLVMLDVAENAQFSTISWIGPDGQILDCYRNKEHLKPGWYYTQLPQVIRDILKDLKSDDIKNARVDGILF